MTTKKKSGARALIRLLGFAILAAVLYFIDLGELYNNLLTVRMSYLFWAFLAMLPLFVLKSGRWYLLMKTQGIPYTFSKTLLVWSSANFIAFVTPGRLGEVAKAFYVRNDTQIPFSGTFPTVILDRLFDVYFLMTVALYGFFRFSMLERFEILSWVIIGMVVVLPWLLLNKEVSMPLIGALVKLPGVNRFEQKILGMAGHFFDEMKKLINGKLLVSALLTAAAYLSLFLATWFIVLAAGIPIDFVTIAVFTAIANVLSFVPVSVSGVGTREASLIFLFALVDLSAEQAVLYSSLFFLIFYLMGGLVGYACFLIKPIRIDSIKMPGAGATNHL